MATTNSNIPGGQLDREALETALRSVAIRLEENGASPFEIVICGGSALILTGTILRTTKDVDIVALASSKILHSPDPLPDELVIAAAEAAEDLGLPDNWLNNGPSRRVGGLFQMGLPSGLPKRLHTRTYGSYLTVHCIGRFDQIHFKLYAAVDRGGYHIEDLVALGPSPDELETAARWTMSHAVSVDFASVLKDLLRNLGYAETADRL